MKIALRCIFEKKALLWFIIIALFLTVKVGTVLFVNEFHWNFQYLDTWIAGCSALDEDALGSYIAELVSDIREDKQKQRAAERDLSALLASYENRVDMQRLIDFAQNGEGVLNTHIPQNFEELLGFYKTLDTPSLLNEQPLDRFFEMQRFNVVPLIVLLLSAFFWGEFYESGIYRLTASMTEGSRYTNASHILLVCTSILLLLINELIDLWQSGLLRYPYLWGCPVQSYHPFRYMQMNTALGMTLFLSFLSKLFGTLVLCHYGKMIARWKKTVKDSVVYAVVLVVLLFFIGKALENTELRSIVQLGIVDWQSILRSTTILLPLQANSLVIGLGAVIMLEFAFAVHTAYHTLKRK